MSHVNVPTVNDFYNLLGKSFLVQTSIIFSTACLQIYIMIFRYGYLLSFYFSSVHKNTFERLKIFLSRKAIYQTVVEKLFHRNAIDNNGTTEYWTLGNDPFLP